MPTKKQPILSDEELLVRTVLASPKDSAPRLILADELDVLGFDEVAAHLRLGPIGYSKPVGGGFGGDGGYGDGGDGGYGYGGYGYGGRYEAYH